MGARRWRSTALLGAAALAASAALVGCSGGSGDSGSASSQDQQAAAGPAANVERAPAQGGAAPAELSPAQLSPDLRVDQRAIVYTGSITVRVKNVNEAAAKATAIATGAGGFVGADKRNQTSDAADASLELRVPAAKFASVVGQLAGLGDEVARGVNTEDVTEETIDVDARIATQQARVNSGRTLLARAKTLNDLVMLESELAKREADLASLNAKKRRLADLTALSTITVVLLDPEAVTSDDDGPDGFLGGLQAGWKALVASLAVLLTVLGAVLPWLIALGLPLWGAFLLVRRLRPARPVPAAPAKPTDP